MGIRHPWQRKRVGIGKSRARRWVKKKANSFWGLSDRIREEEEKVKK